MAIHFRHAAMVALQVALGWCGIVRGAELPGEDTLPGEARAARALPSEATLPPGFLTSFRAPPATEPTAARRLPPESALPAAQEEDVPLTPDDRPWLRFDLQGHLATIRALAFTREAGRLCTGGEDKAVHVWAPAPQLGGAAAWMHQRAIRWQIERGSRGRIYALAAGPGVLALAGHGAMGGLGEIVMVDPATGDFQRALVDLENGHREVVAGLAFSPDARRPALASQDLQGQVMVWRPYPQTGLWSGRRLTEPDAVRYAAHGAAVLKLLEQNRDFVPLAMPDARTAIVATLASPPTASGAGSALQWRLERIDVETGARRLLPAGSPHIGQVTSLAVSRDGTRIASADASKTPHLFIGSLTNNARPAMLNLPAPALSLAFSDSGRTLLVGTAPSATLQNKAALQIWDVSDVRNPRKHKEYLVEQPVFACGFHPQGRRFAYTQGAEVRVQDWADLAAPPVTLKAPARRPRRVAFHRQSYHIAIGFEGGSAKTPALEQTFDTDRVELGKANQLNPADWRPDNAGQGGWSLATLVEGTTRLYLDKKPAALLPLKVEFNESVTCACWIPDRAGRPFAVAVGAAGRNTLYVLQLAERGVAPILRQFRGHNSTITSVSLSHDRRYLVSCSEDATLRFWKLEDFDRDDLLLNRWGAEFEVVDGELTAAAVREDGPLYFRGMRSGDVLTGVHWIDAAVAGGHAEPSDDGDHAPPDLLRRARRSADTPEAMLAALGDVPWDTLVLFDYARGKVKQPSFQMVPAWREVASLFVAANREWAYWTPAGFYDASFEGHKLFGWQINRGVDQRPDFYLAAQFRKALERPQAMEKLLQAGSLEGAFRQAAQVPPAAAQDALVQQHRTAPRIAILSPQPGQTVRGPTQKVVAAITVREGLDLTPPKAFANGVVAPQRRLVQERAVPQGREYRFEWDALLPSDPQVLIQVAAATDALSAASESVAVERADVPSDTAAAPRRRLFLFAAGVNDYRDPQIQKLDFAVNNARQLARVLKQASGPLYETEVVSLLEERVTPAMWRFVTRRHLEQLKDRASPDDLLVVFLSGHGLRDAEADAYYYVTAGARMTDLMARRYGDCLSFLDLAVFSEIPCRKLVVLDTCHSGAVQPLEQHHLKAAVRALQEDLTLTLTASDGSQQAVEVKEQKHGRFTYYLLQALEGAADRRGGNGDGVVTLQEVVGYVQRQVEAASAADVVRQFPTAGPADVLPYIHLPLAKWAGTAE